MISADTETDTDTALAAYFREAASWDADRVAACRASARCAWRVAAAAAACALAGTAALAALLPLKRVEPYVIRVDSSTGIVDVVPVYGGGHAGLPQMVTRYFLTHYVLVCQRFNYATAESDYEECGAFQSAQRNQAWYALWNRANPASPLNLHRDGSSVSAQVESVSFFQRASGVGDLAQVRYLKIERAAGASAGQVSHWIATIRYTYTAPPADPRIRRWNPLGFRVQDFVAEPEVLRESQGEPSAALAGVAR